MVFHCKQVKRYIYKGEKMRLSKYVTVGGHEIKILFPYRFSERTDLWAQYDDALKEIKVKAIDQGGVKASEGFIFESLIHELFHSIDIDRHIYLFDGEDGENRVNALSSGVYAFIKANTRQILQFIKSYEK